MNKTDLTIQNLYLQALKAYRNHQYGQAMELLQKIYAKHSHALRPLLLEAYIHRSQNEIFAEMAVLERIISSNEPQRDDQAIQAEAWSLKGSVYSLLGKITEARESFCQSASMEPDNQQKLTEYSNALFVSNYRLTRDDIWENLYQNYWSLLNKLVPIPYGRQRYVHKKMRIGYLSVDFCQHALIWFVLPLLEFFDRDSFVVYLYAANKETDEVTSALQQMEVIWRDVSSDGFRETAAKIHQDEIDILMDLGGHTRNNQLPVLAYQPASIQISGIGYFNSTGLPMVDYFLGDVFLDPSDHRPGFSEKMLRLPTSHFCYSLVHEMPAVGPAPVLTKGFITFGSFNNFSKVADDMLLLWRQILEQTVGSRLLLKHRIFDSTDGIRYVSERLVRLGFDLHRIDMQGLTTNYLEEYRSVDIALDTYPYTGGLTTCEALYMGVPVVSLYGSGHGSRFGYSLLTNAGVGELAVDSPIDYVKKAVALAADPDFLKILHENLRGILQKSAVMDGRSYTQNIERLYQAALARLKS